MGRMQRLLIRWSWTGKDAVQMRFGTIRESTPRGLTRGAICSYQLNGLKTCHECVCLSIGLRPHQAEFSLRKSGSPHKEPYRITQHKLHVLDVHEKYLWHFVLLSMDGEK